MTRIIMKIIIAIRRDDVDKDNDNNRDTEKIVIFA